MSRNPQRAGWAMVLTGILGSAAASADCRGIEVATYHPLADGRLQLIETRCHSGSGAFLPWIDMGIEPSLDPAVDRASPEAGARVVPRDEKTREKVRVAPEKVSPR